jgi:hypothetical protein
MQQAVKLHSPTPFGKRDFASAISANATSPSAASGTEGEVMRRAAPDAHKK